MPMPAGQDSESAGGLEPGARRKKRRLVHERAFLDKIPSAEMYEKSFMHRDVVTHVAMTANTEFLVTASADGHVKFWKKMAELVEFVKHYHAHIGPINALEASLDGLRVATTGTDKAVKFFDVVNFDMSNMLRLEYIPTAACWCHTRGSPSGRIALAALESPLVRVYATDAASADSGGSTGYTPLSTFSLHKAPVIVMKFNEASGVVVSGDCKGVLEYWVAGADRPDSAKLPASKVSFKYKIDTDLYDLAKARARPCGLAFSPDGSRFCLTANDKQVRIFDFKRGKMTRKYDESLAIFEDANARGQLKLDTIDFGQRGARERELEATSGCYMTISGSSGSTNSNGGGAGFEADSLSRGNPVFDESGHFVAYATLIGIKVLNIDTNRVVRIIGRVENGERFLNLALYQGIPKVDSQMMFSRMGSAAKSKEEMDKTAETEDPMFICTAFKKSRFYLFSNREPVEDESLDGGRDVFNEKPTAAEMIVETKQSNILGKEAILRTSMGDIHIKLFGPECPRTVENFTVHSRNGYYDGIIFHRVISGFMVQTGDPLGDGTGGESIWGGEFEDEFHRNLRHDRPFTVSMANAGPDTNGSQFFITTVATPWLNNKHTVFGRVTKGMDVVQVIEKAKCNNLDKPYEDIKILNIDIIT